MEIAGESRSSCPDMEYQPKTTATRRRRLLYAWGLSFLRMAHKAYRKAEEVHGPIGSITQRLASLATPLAYLLQYQWLSLLSYIDELILTVENTVEIFFPPSKCVFDKGDSLVHLSEILPRKFDHVLDGLPALIHKIPFLPWIATPLSVGLDLLQWLLDWIFDGAKEVKEIVVDVNCHQRPSEIPSGQKHTEKPNTTLLNDAPNTIEIEPEKAKKSQTQAKDDESTPSEKLGDKERTRKVKEEDRRRSRRKRSAQIDEMDSPVDVPIGQVRARSEAYLCEMQPQPEECLGKMRAQSVTHPTSANGEVLGREDPILDLFEAGWHA